MDAAEIKLRLVEAAAKQAAPAHGQGGWAEGVAHTAQTWYDWVMGNTEKARETLGLPKRR